MLRSIDVIVVFERLEYDVLLVYGEDEDVVSDVDAFEVVERTPQVLVSVHVLRIGDLLDLLDERAVEFRILVFKDAEFSCEAFPESVRVHRGSS